MKLGESSLPKLLKVEFAYGYAYGSMCVNVKTKIALLYFFPQAFVLLIPTFYLSWIEKNVGQVISLL